MKIPTEIVTRNKIRDAAILRLYVQDNLTMLQIGLRFGISAPRVQQIVYKNRHLIKIDKEYEKLKRMAVLKRMLNKHPEELGKKSTLDIVEQMRVEVEGNKFEVSGAGETKIIIIRPNEKKEEPNGPEIGASTITRQISI